MLNGAITTAPLLWFFLDGSASISFSMLLALLLYAGWCDGLPALGWLAEVTHRDNGVIIVASLLLFPCTLVLYGGLRMFFAAKEAVGKERAPAGPPGGPQPGAGPHRQAAG